MGLKKAIQKGKGSLFFNASDLFNTMVIRKEMDSLTQVQTIMKHKF